MCGTFFEPWKDKKSKSMFLPSTLHNQPCNNIEKPEIVHNQYQTKAGVDLTDQCVKKYFCKRGTKRWPLTLFYNSIYIDGYNAFIIFSLKYPEFAGLFRL